MSKKIVLKVCITNDRCKTTVMKNTAKLCGVKSLALDAEKSTLTVVGDVDVVCVVRVLRRAKAAVEVVSVGPEEEEEKKVEKKKEEKEEEPRIMPCAPPGPCCGCSSCSQMACGRVVVYDECPAAAGCTIL